MDRSTRIKTIASDPAWLLAFEDQSEDDETIEEETENDLVIPEDVSELSDEDLDSLTSRAKEAFAALYASGTAEGATFSQETLEALEGLTDGISALDAEGEARGEVAAERTAKAEALAAKINLSGETSEDEGDPDEEDENGDEDEDSEGDEDSADEDVEVEASADEPELVTASARKAVRVNLSHLPSRPAPAAPPAETSLRDVVRAADGVSGYSEGMSLLDMGTVIDKNLQGFNEKQYEAANKAGRHMRQQFGVAVINKPYEDDMVVREGSNITEVQKVLDHAVDEKRLPGGSLVASGGWCAPSETLYELYDEGTSRDGLFSLPEIGITRGGINFTQGPDFASLFASTGFNYTEAEDEAGDYDGQGGGSKPCFKVECPEFDEERLQLDGLCLTAGLLQTRGYPEMIAATTRMALIAHDHRMSGRVISAVAADSTPVTMPSDQVGALAPILTSIELQTEHYKEVHRLARATTLEAVFPYWVRGAVRADLSRRLGIDLIDVPDSRIDAWFRSRGVSPQFVYNWQGLANGAASAAGGLTEFPSTVDFLLYSAGTWVKGGSDVITLDTIYDSVMLGTNDFTALFTEEGWLVAKRGHDSRLITTSICADGATAAGVAIECDGSAGA